jgi:hypothetical protein
VATLRAIKVAGGERRTGLRLVAQPSGTIRGRAIDYQTGRPIAGARAEGRGMSIGQIGAVADATGRFTLAGLPPGQLVDFAIVAPSGDYITDCQHRVMPAKGGTVEIGDVPLFPGPQQRLGARGAMATGLWFQSQEGRPAVYSVVPGSPGDLAGVRPGGFVLAVDDTDVRKLSSSVVEGLVATGSRLFKLTIQSGGDPRVFTIGRIEPGPPSQR